MKPKVVTVLAEYRKRGYVALVERVLDDSGIVYETKEVTIHKYRSESAARKAFEKLVADRQTRQDRP